MSKTKETLLLAGADRAGELTSQLQQVGIDLLCHTQIGEAMALLSRQTFNAVIFSVSPSERAGLLQAIRELQPQAQILAVCDPGDEPEIRDMLGLTVDEYFIHPPSDSDLIALAHLVAGRHAQPSQLPALLDADTVCELVDAATSLPVLEKYLAEKTSRLTGAKVTWVSAKPDADRVLLTLEGRNRLYLQAEDRAQIDEATRGFLSAVKTCLPSLVTTVHRTETLHRLAITDHLTGAYNRRYFYHASDRILREAEGQEARVTLLLFDIDDFKKYNDTYGHATGDLILQEVTQLMRSITRSQDIVARIGGDEFAVLFWDEDPPRKENSTPPAQAGELARRFCRAIKDHAFTSLGTQGVGKLTISGGLASFPSHGRTCQELLRKADVALHEAKNSGKNSICLVGKVGQYVSEDQADSATLPKPNGQG
jgi:diguanylate cyclase (GGDEF)-like protein